VTDAAPEIDLENEAERNRHPQLMYKFLRDHMPVMEVDHEVMSGTMVSRHEDVTTILRNPDVFSSGVEAAMIGQIRPLIPLQIDPPEHAKFRKILDPLFSPRRVAELEPSDITQVVLLGTGTPNVDPERSGPSTAIVSPIVLFLRQRAGRARKRPRV